MEQGQVAEQPGSEVDSFAAILNQEAGEPQEPQEPQAETPEGEVEEVTTADESPEPQDENTITIDPEAPMFEVTIKAEGGTNETKKVSLKDLESGYMMQADYQRKTAELARAREQLTTEVQQMIEPERQAYVQNLNILQQAVLGLSAPELQNVNWEQLAAEDPAKYVQLTAKAQRVQQTLQHIQAQQQQAEAQARQKAAEQSKRMLSDPIQGIPNWGAEVYQSLINEGSKMYGFTPEEVAQVVDYRMIKVLHDAQQYQKLKAAKPIVEKKVTAVPKVLKPGTPAVQGDIQAKQDKEVFQKLKKTGDLRDAASAFLVLDKRKK
jgi:hypothetical protein